MARSRGRMASNDGRTAASVALHRDTLAQNSACRPNPRMPLPLAAHASGADLLVCGCNTHRRSIQPSTNTVLNKPCAGGGKIEKCSLCACLLPEMHSLSDYFIVTPTSSAILKCDVGRMLQDNAHQQSVSSCRKTGGMSCGSSGRALPTHTMNITCAGLHCSVTAKAHDHRLLVRIIHR